MHHTLRACTDAGTFVLFDPGSVRYILRGEITLKEFDLDREVNEGRVLAYSAGGDGDVLVRAYVDEAPEDRIEEHAEENLDGALLRVPTGRLIFSGLEDLSPVPNEQMDRSDDVQPRTGVVIDIPPGEYRVRAFDVDWGSDDEKALDRIKTSWDRRIDTWIGPAMGFAIVVTVFVIPAILLIAGLEFGRDVFWSASKYVVIGEIAIWAVLVPMYRFGAKRSSIADPRRDEIEAAHPAAVIVLRRLPNGADVADMRGGKFGIGYAQRTPKRRRSSKI